MSELYNWKPIGEKKERKKIALLSTIKNERRFRLSAFRHYEKERNEDPSSHTTNLNNNMYMKVLPMFTDDLSLYTLKK